MSAKSLHRGGLLLTLLAAVAAPASAQSGRTSFFLTSSGPGSGAELTGVAGADNHCTVLAANAGLPERAWRAYLSVTATDSTPAVNARDRIGTGPWYNYSGVLVAGTIEQLHGENNLDKVTALTENGDVVNGRGDSPNQHDILTGSRADGTAFPPGEDTTCSNWTSRGAGSARVGHHDRNGGGEDPTSWNSAHLSRGCGQEDLQGTGGNGYFYCFGI
ncbi:MAG: lectin [Gemmatimonadota bacterium]